MKNMFTLVKHCLLSIQFFHVLGLCLRVSCWALICCSEIDRKSTVKIHAFVYGVYFSTVT